MGNTSITSWGEGASTGQALPLRTWRAGRLEPAPLRRCRSCMNALARYDSPPSSSPRLFFGLVAGSVVTMALMLGLVFSSARPAQSASTAPTASP